MHGLDTKLELLIHDNVCYNYHPGPSKHSASSMKSVPLGQLLKP